MNCLFFVTRTTRVLWFARSSFWATQVFVVCTCSFGLHKFCGLCVHRFGLQSSVACASSLGLHNFLRFARSSFRMQKFCGLYVFVWATQILWFECSSFWATQVLWFARVRLCCKFCGLRDLRFGLHKFYGLYENVWSAQVLWFARSSSGLHKFCGLHVLRLG